MKRLLPWLCFLFCFPLALLSQETVGIKDSMLQDSTLVLRIETTDNNVFIGTVVSQTPAAIILRTDILGEIAIPRTTIRKMGIVQPEQLVDGQYWEDNPSAGFYFFSQSALGLRSNEASYQNTWLIVNQVTMGFSDHFSVGLGVIPLFAVFPVWIAPNIHFPLRENLVQLGVNGLFGYVPIVGEDEGSGFGMSYAQVTYGSRDRHISFGLGGAYEDGKWNKHPMLVLSGQVRTGKKFAFVSENYYLQYPGFEAVMSLGCRFIGQRVCWDLGLFAVLTGEDYVGGSPWLGIRVPVGKKK